MFYETIKNEQFDLLKKLSELKEVTKKFYLAGGTALSLQLGHRISEDLDFFSEEKFNSKMYSDIIEKLGGNVSFVSKDTVLGIIGKTRISFFLYPYKLIRKFKRFENINMTGLEDLACMKLKAITQRGVKRDYYDIYEILKLMQPMELKNFMIEKYESNGNSFYHLARSLVYFDEADGDIDPISLNGTTWKIVKDYLIKNQRKILKSFT